MMLVTADFLTILVSRTRCIDSRYKDIHLHMIILTFLIGRSRYIDSKNKTHIYMEIVCKDLNTREKKNHVFIFKKLFRLLASCEPQLGEEIYIIKNTQN